MEITTDAILKGPVWAEMLDKLTKTIFKTNWDVYALSISVGMMHDGQISSDNMIPNDYDAEPRYVPRSVLGHDKNKSLLEFMLQGALLTTKHLDFDENTRLKLAFNDGKSDDDQEELPKIDFNPIAFLTKYANYGIMKIKEAVSDTDDVETLEMLMTFLNSTYELGVNAVEDEDEFEYLDEFEDLN